MATTLGIPGECGVFTIVARSSEHPAKQLNMSGIPAKWKKPQQCFQNSPQSSPPHTHQPPPPPPPQSITGDRQGLDMAAGCDDAHGDADVNVAAARGGDGGAG